MPHHQARSARRRPAPAARCALALALGVSVGTGAPSSAGTTAAVADRDVEPRWSLAQEVSPAGEDHTSALIGVHPDGTLVAVWLHEDVDPETEERVSTVLRRTKPMEGGWTEPVVLPVPGVVSLDAIAPQQDGELQVAFTVTPDAQPRHQVRAWHADGSVGDVALRSASDAFDLSADVEGDVVATRLGRRRKDQVLYRVVHHLGGSGWQRLPRLDADPRDLYLAGPGDTVWMAGYDRSRTRLDIRRWAPPRPGTARWSLEWSRDFAARRRGKPLVTGLDLALGDAGQATFAFLRRARGDSGAVMRIVQREATSEWGKPIYAGRQKSHHRQNVTAPVVAVAGDHSVVAWTEPGGPDARDVIIAWVVEGVAERRQVGVSERIPGSMDLALDLDVRVDGEVLLTYFHRVGTRRQVLAWVGERHGLQVTRLVRDAGVMRGDASIFVPGRAAVLAQETDGRLLSFTQER